MAASVDHLLAQVMSHPASNTAALLVAH
jgi:hypothetical protein